MKINIICCLILAINIFLSCSSADVKETKSDLKEGVVTDAYDKQLNINILWDLSDRIDPKINPASPEHYERDIEIIKSFTEFFKQDMDKRGAYMSKGKLKVLFSPIPANEEINNIARNLEVDVSKFKGDGSSKEKKKVFDEITSSFNTNAKKIYDLTIRNNNGKADWDGSDIWRFFKNDVDRCIESNYRNILVILTDGYIYHKDSKETQGSRTQFLLPQTFKPLRNNPNWKEIFDANNLGLQATRKDLEDLEVLVLEVQPTEGNRNDEDYIKAYLEKWFGEMGVKPGNASIYISDLPLNTKKRIENFLNKS